MAKPAVQGVRFSVHTAGDCRPVGASRMMRDMTNPTIAVYGIPNCDTVKKARAWLNAQRLEHQFHDFKKQGVPADRLTVWMEAVGWQKLVNRQGTTWRKLGAEMQSSVKDEQTAHALMLTQPSVIKRPVVEWPSSDGLDVSVGFDLTQWQLRMSPPRVI